MCQVALDEVYVLLALVAIFFTCGPKLKLWLSATPKYGLSDFNTTSRSLYMKEGLRCSCHTKDMI